VLVEPTAASNRGSAAFVAVPCGTASSRYREPVESCGQPL
jgi:hypothetical protein